MPPPADASQPAPKSFSRKSAQDRAGVKFPINRLAKFAKQSRYADRIGSGVPVFMAGVLEYLTFELLELASHQAQQNGGKKTIMPRHIMLAIKSDPEFNKYFKMAEFHETGRLPQIIASKKDNKKKKGADEEEEGYGSEDDESFEQDADEMEQ